MRVAKKINISRVVEYDENGKPLSNDACYLSWQDFYADAEAIKYSGICDNLMIVMLSMSSLVGLLILEFAVPLILKKGKTVGKLIMHIGLLGTDRVKSAHGSFCSGGDRAFCY